MTSAAETTPRATSQVAPGSDANMKGEQVTVALETEKGTITLELDPSAAPVTVRNYVELVKSGFYNGMPFHRVEPGFVIQAGDPNLTGKPPVPTIQDERSPIKHTRGVIAMARLYRNGQMVPNSASSQFYLCLGDSPHLDTMGFTAFGHVTQGLEVMDKIQVGDKIVTTKVIEPAAK